MLQLRQQVYKEMLREGMEMSLQKIGKFNMENWSLMTKTLKIKLSAQKRYYPLYCYPASMLRAWDSENVSQMFCLNFGSKSP